VCLCVEDVYVGCGYLEGLYMCGVCMFVERVWWASLWVSVESEYVKCFFY